MKKNLTIPYAAIQASFIMIYAGCGAFISSHLLPIGYTSTEIGMILSSANLAAVVLQPFQAAIASKNNGRSLYSILCLITGFLALLCLPMLFLMQRSPLLTLLYVLLVAGNSMLSPLVNALSNRVQAHDIAINYGVSRGMGSAGYACATGLVGMLIPHLGIAAVPGTSLVCLLSLLCILLATARLWPGTDVQISDTAVHSDETWLQFFRSNKRFAAMNLGSIFLLFGLYATMTYLLQIVQPLGGSSVETGHLLSMASILEVPAMFAFDSLRKRFRNNTLLRLSILGLIGKTLITFAAPSLGFLYAAQVFQMIGFALYFPAMIQYITENLNARSAIRAQTLFSLAVTLSGMAANFAGGMLIDSLGVPALGWVCILFHVLGATILLASIATRKR